jgi:hypothetical protein
VPWWSSKTSLRLARFIATALLEVLPVEAILLVVTGIGVGALSQTPMPFWFMCGALLLAWGISRFLIGASFPRMLAVSVPFLIGCALLLIRISPSAYGPFGNGFFDWSWVFSVNSDLVNHAPQATSIPPLLLLLVYIWWRGLRLGSDPPEFSTLMNHFKYGMAAIIIAVIAVIGVQRSAQQLVTGILGFLLLLEVFSGLLALALGRIAMNREEHRGDAHLATNDQLWFGTAIVLGLLTVGFGLFINLIVNYQSVGALLNLLGPVGPAVSNLVQTLIYWLAQVLNFLFGWIFTILKPNHASGKITLSHPNPPNTHQKPQKPPQQLLVLAGILLEGAAILAVIFFFLWLMRTIVVHRRAAQRLPDEERESLDASSIFRQQMRAFLAGLRPTRAPAWVDPLTPGSVRYLYRSLIETASSRQLPRKPSETPDEYSARLASSPLLPGESVEERSTIQALNSAYDETRYARREPSEQEMVPLRTRAKRLMERLSRR